MTKTTAPRVRQINLYTVEQDGQPVAQAEAISQAEAVALWVASQQQPTLAARLSTPREARALAHLPLLSRGAAPERDPRVPDMFDDVPAATDHVEEVTAELPGESAEPVSLDVPAPAGVDLVGESCAVGCDGAAAADGGLATGEPMPSGPSTAAPTVSHAPAGGVAPEPDAAAWTARLSNAYHTGLSLGQRGLRRYCKEMLGAEAAFSDGLIEQQAEAVCAEVLRGFDDGHAASRPEPEPEPKGAGKVVAKYRNPETGESWSGRGLKPRWLVAAIDAGRSMDEFLIPA